MTASNPGTWNTPQNIRYRYLDLILHGWSPAAWLYLILLPTSSTSVALQRTSRQEYTSKYHLRRVGMWENIQTLGASVVLWLGLTDMDPSGHMKSVPHQGSHPSSCLLLGQKRLEELAYPFPSPQTSSQHGPETSLGKTAMPPAWGN